MHMCVYHGTHLPRRQVWEVHYPPELFLWPSTLLFNGEFLHCTWSGLGAGQQVLGAACLWALPKLGLQMCVPIHGFSLGDGDPNSGPHICAESTLPTEPSLWPQRTSFSGAQKKDSHRWFSFQMPWDFIGVFWCWFWFCWTLAPSSSMGFKRGHFRFVLYLSSVAEYLFFYLECDKVTSLDIFLLKTELTLMEESLKILEASKQRRHLEARPGGTLVLQGGTTDNIPYLDQLFKSHNLTF